MQQMGAPPAQAPAQAPATQQAPAYAPPAMMGGVPSFAGVRSGVTRYPELDIGSYRLQFEKTRQVVTKTSITYIADFKVLESNNPKHQAGTMASIVRGMSTPLADSISKGEIKGMVRAACGFADDTAFEAALPVHADTMAAHQANPLSPLTAEWEWLCVATFNAEQQTTPRYTPNPLCGATVKCEATPGNGKNLKRNGQGWNNYSFLPDVA
jgi:hypothetical protein